MEGLCAEKKALGPRKRFDCSTLQSITDKESTNRGQARDQVAPRPSYQRLTRLYRALDGYMEAPNAQRQAQIAAISRELHERLDGLKAVVSGEIAELNRAIEENQIPRIQTPATKKTTS